VSAVELALPRCVACSTEVVASDRGEEVILAHWLWLANGDAPAVVRVVALDAGLPLGIRDEHTHAAEGETPQPKGSVRAQERA
jgi:hypothetical protein